MHPLRLTILSLLLLLWAAPVWAGTVAILRLPRSNPALTEALSRLHGELLSVGLEVRLLGRPRNFGADSDESWAWLERVASESRFDAVIEVEGSTAPVAANVWVVERSPRRLEYSKVVLEPTAANPSERLAIRTVEFLRSTFLVKDMVKTHEPVVSSPPPNPPPIEAPQPLRRLGLELGASALTSLDGVGPAVLPMARFDWVARSWLVVYATLAGLGSHPTVATTDGNARVAQQYAILGNRFRFGSDQSVRPFLALSIGALHTSVEGQADLPRQGHTGDEWSFLLDGSLGIELPLSERYFLALSGHAQLAEPIVAIHFMDEVVATTGRPNLAAALTIGAWL